ncbi:hypothetical protein B0A67_23915 [Flavobacterium aquidurense]|uniref:M23 family metallopeptidase n=1 Tax=Flavobacterium aquidurense TaxID=362413 RepID=UPI0009225D25|nr:hypothetical protein B0A67_23915 [Flavobacterium aquidurense]SHH84952.1 Peptidase family M23 [Flavobacterium frigidimaris]
MKVNIFLILSLGLCWQICHSQKTFFPKKKTEPETEVKSSFFKKASEETEKTKEELKPIKDTIISSASIVDNSKVLYSIKNDSVFDLKNKDINFLTSPLEKGRITSSYSKNRFHPVLKKWSAHKGTDFAAPYGTPIEATAGGVIEKTGYTKANGNFVKIKHNDTYSTQYLHMSKILVKQNQIIKKGEKIGLVGSTGYASGPHVCYRFWVNGVQVDPFSVNIAAIKTKHTLEKTSLIEEENEKDFKTFVSGFFKKIPQED